MAELEKGSGLGRFLPLVNLVTEGTLALFLGNVLEVWDLVSQVRDRVGYHSMYDILAYDAMLELHSPDGEEASITRHQVIRFLQNNVVAIHDHAWGDGELFAEYHCQPGMPVDFYEDGAKHNVLISLREAKNRGDVMELWIQRVIRGGFREAPWWLETEIDHLTKNMKLSVIFPKDRLCQQATMTRKTTKKTTPLGDQYFTFLRDGRQQLTWESKHPKLHDLYTIKWLW